MGDGRTPYESAGAGEKFRKRLFRPGSTLLLSVTSYFSSFAPQLGLIWLYSEIYEDSQNDSQEAGWNNSSGASDLSNHQRGNLACISDTVGKSKLEETLKEMIFTRSEAQRLMALVHSRTMEESPSSLLRFETSSTSGSPKKLKHGDDKDNSHAAITSSRVVKEQLASPAEFSKHPSTLENLPDELLVNIFIRLLAKQLAQMRSVSKLWNGLLSQSSFIRSHLHRSIHANDQILLVFYKIFSNLKPFTAYPCQSHHLELTNFIKLRVNPRPEYAYGIRVIGSVNGLICSLYSDSIIHIWNPSLSAMLTLPPYSMPSSYCYSIKNYFRFGFDPSTNDYKVVKLMGYSGPSVTSIKCWLQVEVFSMKKGLWELITDRFPSHITWIFDDDVCVDGHLHWLGCTNKELPSNTIVAFDLGSVTFREISLPHPTLDYDYCHNLLGVLDGKHCVITQFRDDACEVWVMEEYGVVESWVKRHVFSHFIGDIIPYGFTSHNGFLLYDDDCLVLYDPVASKTEIIENFRLEEGGAHKIVEYVDSLVWVAPAEREVVDDVGQN